MDRLIAFGEGTTIMALGMLLLLGAVMLSHAPYGPHPDLPRHRIVDALAAMLFTLGGMLAMLIGFAECTDHLVLLLRFF